MDAYMFENLTHGMVKNEMDRFDKGLRDNLTKAMAGLGLDYQEINDYLKAKHIPERNAYFEQKNGKEIAGGLSTEEANKRTQPKNTRKD